MEHHEEICIPIKLTVSLWRGGEHLGWFATRNICERGLSIQGCLSDLPDSSVLTVCVEHCGHGQTEAKPFKAVVVHRDTGNIELMWVEPGVSGMVLLLGSIHSAA